MIDKDLDGHRSHCFDPMNYVIQSGSRLRARQGSAGLGRAILGPGRARQGLYGPRQGCFLKPSLTLINPFSQTLIIIQPSVWKQKKHRYMKRCFAVGAAFCPVHATHGPQHSTGGRGGYGRCRKGSGHTWTTRDTEIGEGGRSCAGSCARRHAHGVHRPDGRRRGAGKHRTRGRDRALWAHEAQQCTQRHSGRPGRIALCWCASRQHSTGRSCATAGIATPGRR